MHKSVAIITQNLSFGGVQKNVSALANYLAIYFEVSLVLFEKKPICYPLSNFLRLYYLPFLKLPDEALSKSDENSCIKVGEELFDFRVEKINEIFRLIKADVYISFEDYNNSIVLSALNGSDSKTIISSRVSFGNMYKDALVHLLPRSFYEGKVRELYHAASHVACVSKAIEVELKEINPKINSLVISNGVDARFLRQKANEPVDFGGFILSAGRIEFRQKGQDELLKAYAKISGHMPQKLIVAGDGTDKQKLEEQVKEFGLSDRAFCLGFTDNPYRLMKNSDFFVFTSHYEGFPNTLLEAMALGVACISYDFEPSWEELTCGGECAMVVKRGDIDALADAMVQLSQDADLRHNMAKKAKAHAEKYSMFDVLAKWKKLVDLLHNSM